MEVMLAIYRNLLAQLAGSVLGFRGVISLLAGTDVISLSLSLRPGYARHMQCCGLMYSLRRVSMPDQGPLMKNPVLPH